MEFLIVFREKSRRNGTIGRCESLDEVVKRCFQCMNLWPCYGRSLLWYQCHRSKATISNTQFAIARYTWVYFIELQHERLWFDFLDSGGISSNETGATLPNQIILTESIGEIQIIICGSRNISSLTLRKWTNCSSDDTNPPKHAF